MQEVDGVCQLVVYVLFGKPFEILFHRNVWCDPYAFQLFARHGQQSVCWNWAYT